MGDFDFGDLGEDMSAFLDIRRFVEIAQEEDLFVIFRPGPYICAEWEFGGMPRWVHVPMEMLMLLLMRHQNSFV